MNMKHSIRGIDLSSADFSDALMWLKDGKRVMRRGWNGKGQYVILIPGAHLARSAGYGFGEALGEFTFGSVLALKNAQNIMQPGWIPSMGDLLAEDWALYEEPQASGLSEQQQLALEELEQINEKLESLANFINDPGSTFTSLSWEEQHQLRMKAAYQADYARALKRIIDGLGGEGRGGTE